MKKFLRELSIFLVFVASIVCFYLSLTAFFASMLLNIICFFSAVFLLIQGSGMVDKLKGYGPNSNSNQEHPERPDFPGHHGHNDFPGHNEHPPYLSNENPIDAPEYEGDDEI